MTKNSVRTFTMGQSEDGKTHFFAVKALSKNHVLMGTFVEAFSEAQVIAKMANIWPEFLKQLDSDMTPEEAKDFSKDLIND